MSDKNPKESFEAGEASNQDASVQQTPALTTPTAVEQPPAMYVNKSSPLHKLPPELRAMIYQLVLPFDSDIKVVPNIIVAMRGSTFLHHEAASLYCEQVVLSGKNETLLNSFSDAELLCIEELTMDFRKFKKPLLDSIWTGSAWGLAPAIQLYSWRVSNLPKFDNSVGGGLENDGDPQLRKASNIKEFKIEIKPDHFIAIMPYIQGAIKQLGLLQVVEIRGPPNFDIWRYSWSFYEERIGLGTGDLIWPPEINIHPSPRFPRLQIDFKGRKVVLWIRGVTWDKSRGRFLTTEEEAMNSPDKGYIIGKWRKPSYQDGDTI